MIEGTIMKDNYDRAAYSITQGDIIERCRKMIYKSWEIFSNKVGQELILINKEASMQLQYAYIIQQMIPLILFRKEEKVELELETGVSDGNRLREVDIMISVQSDDKLYRFAIELKCYKTVSSSGGKRGAQNIFMKDVYEDMYLIERYVKANDADEGICLVMTDHKTFPYPRTKSGRCWDYDISQGAIAGRKEYTTDIAGKSVYINLEKEYQFNWDNIGKYYFLILKGK